MNETDKLPVQMSYVLTVEIVAWIREQAKLNGKSASEFLRGVIEDYRSNTWTTSTDPE